MESPERICLSVIIVVNILLLSSFALRCSALPLKNETEATKDTITVSRYSRVNNATLTKPNADDVALNELKPKEPTSIERIDTINNKYKDRGRIKFNSYLTSTTEVPRRKIKTTSEIPKVTIVTPTPKQKNVTQIIDSMLEYKKTKIPTLVTSSSTPISADLKESFSDEDDTYEDDEFSKFVSDNFRDSSFFTIPDFNDDDMNDDEYSHDTKKHKEYNKHFSVPPYEKFSSYIPNESSYKHKSEKYEPSSYFHDFEGQLTTPKNDFFDKRFHEISSSILKNMNSIKTQSPSSNVTNVHKIVKENVGLERLSNGSPNNKSMVIIKNTKEVRLLDNDKAGSAQKELSDVHGTSIYYEMSVLSTETYTIHNDDNDCDNDTSPFEPTKSTAYAEEKASIKSTTAALQTSKINNAFVSSTIPPPVLPEFITSTENPFKNNGEYISTYHATPNISSFSIRHRGYPKSINFSGKKEISNSVTVKNDAFSSNRYIKPVNTRRIQYTTPRNKPVWMAPRRNITRPSYTRPSQPTTIYSEYFNIKDKFNLKPSNKTSSLTTVSSDIDPVFQTDIMGSKKVVNSQSISDNSIPGLRKRGSAKFSSSTPSSVNSTDAEDSTMNMEIPPSSAAWALAGMRNPPSLTSPVADRTNLVRKPDENELQSVAEVTEKAETTTNARIPSKIEENANAEFTSKKTYDVEQNRLPWKPITSPFSNAEHTHTEKSDTETKTERISAESNVSFQNNTRTDKTVTSSPSVDVVEANTSSGLSTKETTTVSEWISATSDEFFEETTDAKDVTSGSQVRPSAFESITKFPSGLTTPQNEDNSVFGSDASPENTSNVGSHNTAFPFIPTVESDVEITTIRFSYVPTITEEPTETVKLTQTTPISDTWHPVLSSQTTTEAFEDTPVTTYRPKYITTTDIIQETTLTPKYETSTSKVEETTETKQDASSPLQLASTPVTQSTTSRVDITPLTTVSSVSAQEITPDTFTQSETEETTTIIVEVVTEINTERETSVKYDKSTPATSQETTSGDLSTETEFITLTSFETSESNSNRNELMTNSNEHTSTDFTHKFTTNFRIETTEESRYDTTTTTSKHIETTTMPTINPTETIRQETMITEGTTKPMTSIETTKTVYTKANTDKDEYIDTSSEEMATKSTSDLDDSSGYGEHTTKTSSHVIEDAGSGAAVAIAVSTIGVIALVMLVGLLLVVRRRGRRGVYAQRCTPVSLDAYSLDSVSVGPRKGNPRLRASKRSYGNPAYNDEVTSHPMQYAALANFALDMESITTEFSEIPSVTVRPDEVPVGCEDKNRYSNVLPLPETRVPLQRIGNDPATEYINANFITGPGNIKNYYIACQAPLANTAADFWRMIWEQNSRLVVMLTEYMENGVEKCYEYLPPSEVTDNKRIFGDFQIVLKNREQRDKYAISSVQLTNLGTRTWREVTHLWYFWPAKGVPDDYDSIIDFMSEMRSYMKISQAAKEYDEDDVEVIYGNESRSSFNNLHKFKADDGSGNGVNVYSPQKAEEMMRRANNGTLGRMKVAADVEAVRPCVVVCASGAGRSAALVALDVCARALAAGRVDVPRVVREIRAQRPHSLANRHHYIFLYKVLSEYGNKLMGGGVDNI